MKGIMDEKDENLVGDFRVRKPLGTRSVDGEILKFMSKRLLRCDQVIEMARGEFRGRT
jgi:hypothetical protein